MKLMVFIIFFSISALFSDDNIKLINAINIQINNLSDNEKRLLEFSGIIIINTNRFPFLIHEYNGIKLSDIVISENLVPCPFDRFYIAHYLRNQMHSGFRFYDTEQNIFLPIAEPFYFSDYESYIHRNAELICVVIYHFISDKYYKVYTNFPAQSYLLLTDNRLHEYLDLLIDKLKDEGLYFPLHY